MKPKRIISLLLAICLVAGLMPTAAFAAGTDTGKAIQLGTSGISDPTPVQADRGTYYTPSDYVYFGVKGNDPIKWRVLDADKTNDGTTSGMFLLSEYLLDSSVVFESASNSDDNDGQSNPNEWQHSDAQNWCSTFATNTSVFSTAEQAAFLGVEKNDNAESSLYGIPWDASSLTENDKVFFLSARELADYVGSYDGAPGLSATDTAQSAGSWWLRSPHASVTNSAGAVNIKGTVGNYTVNYDWAARPAFNLDLNSVLFTSAAVGGKPPAAESGGNQSGGDADAIFEISDYSGNEWKLTLLDEAHKNFEISNATINDNDDTITFSYSGAQTGTNEYISVVIVDNGAITHYGRILQLGGTTNGESGTASLTLPAGVTLGDTTKLYVFNEQYNGDKMTDYASPLRDIGSPTVDTTAPTLSNGSATRDSETSAAVKFTSSEAGTCYYIAQDTEITLTKEQIAAQGTQQACEVGENEIKLDNISASAQYVAVVAQDAAGNISDVLKFEIPAYIAPVYAISADTQLLDFGTVTEGYTQAPAAKTVTITNTGNQDVTVDLPTSTNYIITAGEGFTNDTATLAPNGTAAFTIQPKTGLGADDYSETLTISGSNGTNANVQLSFAVTETAPVTYTLTVELNGGSGNTTGGQYPAGEVVNIDAGSRSSYRFNGWTSSNGGSFASASSASTTFTMPAADTTITANWKDNGSGGTGGSTTDYYRLTFDTNGGSEIASILRAEYTTVDLSDYKPTREGYEFTGWYADKDLTDKITSIRLTRNTTVYAGWEEKKEIPGTGFENPFTDVSENDWFYDDVMFVFANDLMVGTGDATFSPEISTSRAMIAVTLWRMEGEPAAKGANPYTDVENGAWYTEAITWANENGIAEGYGNGCFQPETPVTREQLAAFFYRYAAYKGYDITITGSLDHFNDKDNVSEWAKDTMAWAVGYGLIGGKDNNMLDPQGEATRAEFAAMLQRFCQKG